MHQYVSAVDYTLNQYYGTTVVWTVLPIILDLAYSLCTIDQKSKHVHYKIKVNESEK